MGERVIAERAGAKKELSDPSPVWEAEVEAAGRGDNSWVVAMDVVKRGRRAPTQAEVADLGSW